MEGALRRLRDSLPIFEWIGEYDRTQARGDLLAGLTVGVMLIPQGMAYAVLAGVPPIYGLYASVVPLLVYPLFGSSRHISFGVNAVSMIIVASGVGAVAAEGSERYVVLAVLVTGMAGILLVGMGALRLGFLANLLSRPVIAGFATAAALIITFSQAGNFLGIDLHRSEYVHEIAIEVVGRSDAIHLPSVLIAVGGIGLIGALRWWKPIFPAELAVLVLATLSVDAFGLAARGVAIVGEIPSGLPRLALPSGEFGDVRALVPSAITLALVQFMSVVSLGRIFANRHGYEIDANRELNAVGSANVLGSLFQCIPATASFSRSAVNEQAGARTPLANAVAAGVVVVVLLFLTPFFHALPLPALAAIIIVAAMGLLDLAELRFLFRTKRVEGWVAISTFGSTLVLGVEEGLLLGIGAAVVAVLYRQSRPHVAELGHLSATREFKNVERFAKAYPIEGLMILRIEAGFSFFNAQFLKEFILEKASDGNVRAVVLDGGSINDLDTTALEALERVVETLEEQGIEIYFSGLTGPVRDVMGRSGLGEILGPDRFHMTPHRAVRHLLGKWDDEERGKGRRLELYDRSTELPEEEVEPTKEADLT